MIYRISLIKTPSCSSTPVLNHLDLLLHSPRTPFSVYPNAMNHNICTYQSTSEMSKTQMVGVQIKLGAEVAWSKGTRLIKRILPDTSLELSGWIDSLPWKDLIEKDDLASWESRKTTGGFNASESRRDSRLARDREGYDINYLLIYELFSSLVWCFSGWGNEKTWRSKMWSLRLRDDPCPTRNFTCPIRRVCADLSPNSIIVACTYSVTCSPIVLCVWQSTPSTSKSTLTAHPALFFITPNFIKSSDVTSSPKTVEEISARPSK